MCDLIMTKGNMPLLATAIHAGHAMRPVFSDLSLLSSEARYREEDPYTDRFVNVSDTSAVALQSRFEYDLNRAPAKAVYIEPADAWGLDLWKEPPSPEMIGAARARHADAYARFAALLDGMLAVHPKVVIYDIHSYNHQREGPGRSADPRTDPDVNLGTANMDRSIWSGVVDILMEGLSRRMPDGCIPVVGENVKFKGGYFTAWAHQRYGERVCPVAIEFKKTFMDEWTGIPDPAAIQAIRNALAATVGPVTRICHAATAA